ncbi:UDP-N-acetylenolpyruvoylglucosamine reductase-like isoform X1 [Macadamia integrifolia]|uniref:UDP-N-acetylenolpyruvoylglucosamine reductase-like isoform X1 n=1 Tax=Macadamia integrifolia TaxID=60698 RepID=UPI001C534262|nr:UDP-N-acetylenolpyruvoylglucosamine reductase-like isoform X1 [Macadamia integrifolia]
MVRRALGCDPFPSCQMQAVGVGGDLGLIAKMRERKGGCGGWLGWNGAPGKCLKKMLTKPKTPSSPSSLNFPVPSPKLNQRAFHGIQNNQRSSISLLSLSQFNLIRTTNWVISKQGRNEGGEEVDEPKLCSNSNGLDFVRGKKLLSELSTLGIGGPCNYFLQVFNPTQLVSAIRYCTEHSIRFIIIGKGSNCLFDDLGFDGCVILNRIDYLERIEPGIYRAGSGYPFNKLGVHCCNEGFGGLEFSGGVPGTVGGAVYMNAGANGQETADTIDTVEIVTIDGRNQTLHRNDLTFGYRRSSFQEMENMAAIVAVTFQLKPSALARERQRAYLQRRRSSQPLVERSAGSVFQNPSGLGISAGELIERAGLKGFSLGGAKVSDIHANFFINSGRATSQEMLELIDFVKARINTTFGIQLEEEIQYIKPYEK